MIEIKINNPNDPNELEKALKLLKKLVNKDGFIQEIKDRKYYMKPSEKRRLEEKLRKRERKHD